MSLRHPVNWRHHGDGRSLGEVLADSIASAIGSWRFLIVQTAIVVTWMTFNGLALTGHLHFDPVPYILLNLAFSTQAAYTGPVLLLAGNRQAQKDRDTLEHTFADAERTLEEIERNTAICVAIERRLAEAAGLGSTARVLDSGAPTDSGSDIPVK